MSEHREPSDVEAKRPNEDQASANDFNSGHYVPLLTDTFTPINRYTVVSTVSVPQEAGTAVAEGPKRKRARTAPANMLVADYLGIDADPIDFKAKVKVRSKHPLAAVLRPNKRKRATLDLAKSATRVSRAGEVASGVRITDGMPVVKTSQQHTDRNTFSNGAKAGEDDASFCPKPLTPERQKTVVVPSTSIDAIRTTSHLGFTAYDSKLNDHRPVSSSSLDSMYQGHEVRRVISRKRSASRNEEDDTAVSGFAFSLYDTLDLDDNKFVQLVDQQYPEPADLREQAPLDDATFKDTTDYTSDFDSDDLTTMYQLADSGYMSSPQKDGALSDQGRSLSSSALGPPDLSTSRSCERAHVTAIKLDEDTWSMFEDDMNAELIDLLQRVETNAQETCYTSRQVATETDLDTARALVAIPDPRQDFEDGPQTGPQPPSSPSAQRLSDSTSDNAVDDGAEGPKSVLRNVFPGQVNCARNLCS